MISVWPRRSLRPSREQRRRRRFPQAPPALMCLVAVGDIETDLSLVLAKSCKYPAIPWWASAPSAASAIRRGLWA